MPSGIDSEVDVAIVGGGIIGLSVAWRTRQKGLSVTVLERDEIGMGTSHVAAGMLAPVAEVEFGEAGRAVLELGLRSAEMWPEFAAELERVSGEEVGLLKTGTLVLARDEDQVRELKRQIAFRESLGLRTTRLRGSEAREREPALASTMRLALEAPDDHSVDPRLVLTALRRACEAEGVLLREHSPVIEVALDDASTQVTGFVLKNREVVFARHLVIAAGAWSGSLSGLPTQVCVPVRPVKGQILRLRDPAGPGLLERVVRFEGGYLVPRADGRYVLGATVEERGFERHAIAGGVYELLRDAHEVVPGVSELQIEELCVGLRPGTPDNVPVIGRAGSAAGGGQRLAVDGLGGGGTGVSPFAGLIWATGHHRNGILLAPLTAELVVETLLGVHPANPLLSACDPLRFTAGLDDPSRTDLLSPTEAAR